MRPGLPLALAALLVALVGCGDDAPTGKVVSPEDTAEPTRSDHVAPAEPLDTAGARDAAVQVRTTGCRISSAGTGSMLDGDLLATAAHVVAGVDEIEVIDTSGTTTTGAVVHFDPDRDFALVRTTAPVGRPLTVRPEPATEGERGIVVLPRLESDDDAGGRDDTNSDDTAVTPMVVGVEEVEVLRRANIFTTDIYREIDVRRDGFELAADAERGDSGAMVVLPGGGVGIVWARSNRNQGRAWGIDLPPVAVDPDARARLQDPVETGRCAP